MTASGSSLTPVLRTRKLSLTPKVIGVLTMLQVYSREASEGCGTGVRERGDRIMEVDR